MQRTVRDVDRTIKGMDKEYDANFGEWVRSEENVDVIAMNLRKYLAEYAEATFSEVLKWITEEWAVSSKILLLHKIFGKQLFRDNSALEMKSSRRNVRIMKGIIDEWGPGNISELIIEFLTGMQKEEKKLFLLWALEDFEHEKLTEIFIRIDTIVDWSLKISIIKKSKVLEGAKERRV
ncbi:uncharacterized protein NEMAJ01_0798 [Nematocida major]|uniref:uncharacterized protein n=1 Tax=Nematocida major TaxID=1912982 RepID=UPI002008383C|nr:uncharacterized protein NEMAJ01_0798 [Nematocida major]KAH9385902.1 hypothetical protein NEMAJ01_0798 [Nematocida major]